MVNNYSYVARKSPGSDIIVLGLRVLRTSTRDTILIYKEDFTWYDLESGDIVRDGLTVATLILSKVRPDVRIKAFEELQKMKLIKPVDFKYDIVDWLAAMEKGRLEVSKKLKNIYHVDAFIEDIFAAAQDVPCELFCSKVASMKQDWNLSNLIDPSGDDVVRKLTKLFVIIKDDSS